MWNVDHPGELMLIKRARSSGELLAAHLQAFFLDIFM
jgi:hypothetical protein